MHLFSHKLKVSNDFEYMLSYLDTNVGGYLFAQPRLGTPGFRHRLKVSNDSEYLLSYFDTKSRYHHICQFLYYLLNAMHLIAI